MKEQLINTLLVVGNALLGLLGAYAVYYINVAAKKVKIQTQQIKDDKQRNLVGSAIDRIQDLTKKGVVATQETTAKELKQMVADGKVDREELVKLSGQLANDIIAQMSPNVKALAETEINDIKAYVLYLIENEVKGLKTEQPQQSSTTITKPAEPIKIEQPSMSTSIPVSQEVQNIIAELHDDEPKVEIPQA